MQKKCKICQLELTLDNFYKVHHSSKWYRSECKRCVQQKRSSYREVNKNKKKRYDQNRYLNNKEDILNYVKSQYNPVKKHQYDIKYRQLNRGKRRYWSRAYKIAKNNAVPRWLTINQIKQMQEIYHNCPKGYEVDHIVPLRGKNVCGLHVPWNLQYLTAKENSCKSNSFIV